MARKPAVDYLGELVEIRDALCRLQKEKTDLLERAVALSDVQATLNAALAEQRSEVEIRVAHLAWCIDSEERRKAALGAIYLPHGDPAGDLRELLSTIAALEPDFAKHVVALIGKKYPANGITDADRAVSMNKIEGENVRLGFAEESMIRAARANGVMIARRGAALPQAVTQYDEKTKQYDAREVDSINRQNLQLQRTVSALSDEINTTRRQISDGEAELARLQECKALTRQENAGQVETYSAAITREQQNLKALRAKLGDLGKEKESLDAEASELRSLASNIEAFLNEKSGAVKDWRR